MKEINLDAFKEIKQEDCVIINFACRVDNTVLDFSTDVIKFLKNSEYIKIFFDEDNRKMMIKPGEDTDFKFKSSGKWAQAKINKKVINEKCLKLMNKAKTAKNLNHIVTGEVHGEAIIFDMSKPETREKRRRSLSISDK